MIYTAIKNIAKYYFIEDLALFFVLKLYIEGKISDDSMGNLF